MEPTKSVKKNFTVGDKVIIKSSFSTYIAEIARVTKTQAISKPINDAGAVCRFKIEYSDGWVTPLPRISWDTRQFTVIPKN